MWGVKINSRQLSLSHYWLVIFAYLLLINSPVYFSLLANGQILVSLYLLLHFSLTSFLAFAIMQILPLVVVRVSLGLLILASCGFAYFIYFDGLILSKELFYVILNPENLVDAPSLFDVHFFMFLLLLSVPGLFLLVRYSYQHKLTRKSVLFALGASLFFLPPVYNTYYQLPRSDQQAELLQENAEGRIVPWVILKYVGKFLYLISTDYQTHIDLAQRSKIEQEYVWSAQRLNVMRAKSDQPLVVMLVIGESQRSTNLGINGYERDTTPLLSARENIISFTQAYACSAATSYSIACIMSRLNADQVEVPLRETSLMSLMRHFGFKSAWSSNNLPGFAFCQEADDCWFAANEDLATSERFDSVLLPRLEWLLSEYSQQDSFLVFNLRGSHFHYPDRYPDEFAIFMPDCQASSQHACAKSQIVNSYDNSILYFDYILDQMIQQLTGKNAILVYVGDHGEYLGEFGLYRRGGLLKHVDSKILTHVPMLIWASENFVNYANLTESFAHKIDARKVTQDDIFHIVTDCVGISGELIDRSRSICASDYLQDE